MSKKGTTADSKESDKFANLLGPTVPAEDRAVREKLITARVGLLLRASFFGNLATRLKLVNADEWCPTAATDGRNFYYNTRFVNMLKPKEIEFLFGHEVLHCVYDHFGRRGDRDPQLWNIANDYCVNADLVKHRVGEKITSVPCLHDSKYDGMSSEEVYDKLMENVQKIDISDLVDKLLDDHLDGDDEGEGGGDDGDEKDGKGRPKLSAAEKQAIKDEIREAVLAAAQASDGAGNLPAGVKRIIQDMTEPKMNWRELLRMQLESTIKSDFTWMRASRRGWHMDAVMPGMKPGEQIDVVIGIDTSGSITDNDLKIFLSEIQGIMESYDEYRITVMGWDTEVHNVATFTSDNLEDISSFEPGGGGGTDPHCVWNYLIENQIEPKKLIMFTDFCFFGWSPEEVEQYCDTVWIIKGNPGCEPPWGIWAHYEEAAKGMK